MISAAVAGVACVFASSTRAQVSGLNKGPLWFLKNGLQLQALSTNFDPFDLSRMQAANYSAVNWLWDSNVTLQGSSPWARWVRPPGTYDGINYPDGQLPPINANESAKMNTLIALSLGDEPNLNDNTIRQNYIDWFGRLQNPSLHPELADKLLYMNNYGGQLVESALADFLARGKPDMISFDTYPYRYNAPNDPTPVQPIGGSPINFYSDLRKYSVYSQSYNTPLGVYRQTYHSTSEGVRDPSESELRLLTSAPLAFNAKYITDFTYNSGASPMYLYAGNAGGSATFYNYVAEANRQARNLGPALVRLKPVASAPDHTTNIMIVRGKHDVGGGSFNYNDIPGYSGFVVDPQSQQYTDWTFAVNDPYLSGFTNVTNNGTKNSGLQGDMLISWFQPLDEWMDGDDWTNEKYLMIVNGLADMNGTAVDCRQTVVLDFNNNTNTQVIQTLDPNGNGAVTDVSLPVISTKRRYTLTLDGGSSMLLKFKDGAPFVGTMPPDAIWTNASGGTFSTAGNWDVNTAPSGNYFLHFGTITGGAGPAYTASLSSALSVKGAFVHNDNVTWNLGGMTLTLTGFAGVDSLIVGMRSGESGSLTLSNGTLSVVNPTGFFSEIGKAAGATGVVTVGNGATWINNGTLLIGKAGAGTLNVTGTANISATNIYVGGSGTSAGGSGVVKLSGGSMTVSGTLKIWNNGTVSVTSGVTPPRVSTLTISGGTLDLASGFIVDYTGSSPLPTLKPQLLTGYNNGAWTGPGITSSHAAAIAADSFNVHKTAVGYLDTSAFNVSSFMDQTVDTTSLLFRYTFTGDTNLDGQVNSTDFTRLAQNFNQTGENWWDGDANFDGKVNALDFNLLASNFGQVMPSQPLAALVPEPMSLLPLAGVLLLARRSRPKFAC